VPFVVIQGIQSIQVQELRHIKGEKFCSIKEKILNFQSQKFYFQLKIFFSLFTQIIAQKNFDRENSAQFMRRMVIQKGKLYVLHFAKKTFYLLFK
jgi:hypothetical protein